MNQRDIRKSIGTTSLSGDKNSMNNTYNPQPMLKKLQALKNSLEDVKQYAYGYAYESEN